MSSWLALLLIAPTLAAQEARPRIRELGFTPGVLATGPLNAITDVAGVRVGHETIVRGDNVRTG
ncbi:MAG TPA: P1 family peptidase, partial [Gemmatimonadales bacterium]|nr:P1 family peptidase [Gemmatimonadales bacterium]